MNSQYQVVNIRVFRGLNLLEDARITDPGSFRVLQNIYRKSPGVLSSRPGSRVYSSGSGYTIYVQSDLTTADTNTTLGTSNTDIRWGGAAELIRGTAADLSTRGPRGTAPRVKRDPANTRPWSSTPGSAATHTNDTQIPVNVSTSILGITPIRVNSLHRLYTNFGSRKFLIGAFDFEGGQGDRLFYVDESTPGTVVTRLMSAPEMTTGSGANWQFVNFYRKDPDTAAQYFALGTNQSGKPFTIGLNEAGKPTAQLLNVKANVAGGDLNVVAVRSMCVYNGSVIYGGYFRAEDVVTTTSADVQFDTSNANWPNIDVDLDLETTLTTTLEDKTNFICFSEPGEPHKIADTDGEISDIRIGDSKSEPVTHVCVNSVSNDAQGTKGQLVVFTTRKVVTYDGLPPVSGNPTGVAFHSVALADVGCVAPATVCQTPSGLLFLGTDGLVYIIPKFSNGGPLPIARTVAPALAHMSLRQQMQCAAVYDDGHYKLSYPNTNPSVRVRQRNSTQPFLNPSANNNADVPNTQLWLDLREPLNPSEIDFGAIWTGPHTGMQHSCFAKATEHEDFNLLFAGSAIDGTIYQTSVEGLASDPKPTDSATIVPLIYDIQTGQFDAGDVHIDKVIHSMQYGVNSDLSVDVVSSIIVSAEVTNVLTGESFTDTFAPVGYTLSQAQTFTQIAAAGTGYVAPADSYKFVSKKPATPKRGRTFRFRYLSSPSTATLIKFSDLAFVFELKPQRRD